MVKSVKIEGRVSILEATGIKILWKPIEREKFGLLFVTFKSSGSQSVTAQS